MTGGGTAHLLKPFPTVQRSTKIESMINFSISLCGYLIIVPIDSQGLLLNINMQKEKLESERWYFGLNNVKYL